MTTTTQRWIKASIPALLIHSAWSSSSRNVAGDHDDGGETTSSLSHDPLQTMCQNNHRHGGGGSGYGEPDTGCPLHAPICVDHNHQVPSFLVPAGEQNTGASGTTGVYCVPCVNYFELPSEPDWGCTPTEPLCVMDATTGKRPLTGQAGTSCMPYPCHNTHPEEQTGTMTEDDNDDHSPQRNQHVDEGCTPDRPMCVNGLGHAPPQGQAGIQCIPYRPSSTTTTITTTTCSTSSQETRTTSELPASPPPLAVVNNNNNNNNMATFGFGLVSTGGAWGLPPMHHPIFDTIPVGDMQRHSPSTADMAAFAGSSGGSASSMLSSSSSSSTLRCLITGQANPPWSKSGPISLCTGCPVQTKCQLGALAW